jgi:hypothetical protein
MRHDVGYSEVRLRAAANSDDGTNISRVCCQRPGADTIPSRLDPRRSCTPAS